MCTKTTEENLDGQKYALESNRPFPQSRLSPPNFSMRQGNVQAAVDQANLLSGVRNDIESVLPCQSLLRGLAYSIPKFLSSAYKSSATESLLAERGRIDSSHQMIDATLEYAPIAAFLVAPTNR